MSESLLAEILQLFIQLMSISTSITVLFYFTSWVVTFLLSMIFPTRYSL